METSKTPWALKEQVLTLRPRPWLRPWWRRWWRKTEMLVGVQVSVSAVHLIIISIHYTHNWVWEVKPCPLQRQFNVFFSTLRTQTKIWYLNYLLTTLLYGLRYLNDGAYLTIIYNNKNRRRYSSDEPWPAEQPPLAVFPSSTRRYWVDMWSAHQIPQLHFQLSKPDRYWFIQVTTQFIRSRGWVDPVPDPTPSEKS
jgi:hypothetical protein